MSKVKLGTDHPSTLNRMANLAFTWRSQGRDADALVLMESCAQARRRVLGSRHPDTISSMLLWKHGDRMYYLFCSKIIGMYDSNFTCSIYNSRSSLFALIRLNDNGEVLSL